MPWAPATGRPGRSGAGACQLILPDLPYSVPLIDDQGANFNTVAGIQSGAVPMVVDHGRVESVPIHPRYLHARGLASRQDRRLESDLTPDKPPLEPLLAEGPHQLIDADRRHALETDV